MSFSWARQSRPSNSHLDVVSPLSGLRRHQTAPRHAAADFTEADDDDEDTHDGLSQFPRVSSTQLQNDAPDEEGQDDEDEEQVQDDDDNDDDEAPRLAATWNGPSRHAHSALPIQPLFSATHLDSLPVYNITHAIRIIVSARTETTLTWDQLRSPQVSQFLVKPMQQQIRSQHFSRSTLYALMANCLQFTKEAQRYPGNAGTSQTRAQVCELLALKILKEYNTRELIDALAYDFYPLQGLQGAPSPASPSQLVTKSKSPPSASRTSTLEVAIRASAKHFLAHPLVVQQLEAIWNGAITFYSAADSLHRDPSSPWTALKAATAPKVNDRSPLLGASTDGPPFVPPGRRTVMLYDPRQASLLKLSRLRVPRYRSFLSTISLAVLIGLFLAVLAQRSVKITGLELVFWFWSAGFMLDELVGFNEQGFTLYILSFWNIFDLGILVLLIVYYCMRAYGVFLVDPHHWNDMAYDVLAANAILLLPRIFSVLDHYQYFSQLLIAFRLMAIDLVAVFTLVLILCSGFFVFFTMSNNSGDGGEVAYKIFQILMGFTPAVWDVWPSYSWLARALMVVFLIICHFLVVTILITVLTNSFTAIASNAREEHQYLFAINTISMVKNDALFSYIAPSNIFAWLLMPLRYCMPLQQFVLLNRTIIKITHFPVLFCIFLYEKFWLATSMYEATDLVENPVRGRGRTRGVSFADPVSRAAMFSPSVRAREESVTGYQKDRALEEVFRRAPITTTLRTQRRNEKRKTQSAIRNWMEQHEEEAAPGNWPSLDSRAAPEWQRRFSVGWDRPSNLRHVSDARSAASDPADLTSNHGFSFVPGRARGPRATQPPLAPDYKDQTDADGDDELVTNDEDEDDVGPMEGPAKLRPNGAETEADESEDYFTTPMATRYGKLPSSVGSSSHGKAVPATPKASTFRKNMHSRTVSTNTILYNPEEMKQMGTAGPSVVTASPPKLMPSQGRAGARSGENPGTPARRSSPRRSVYLSNARPRPILPPRGLTETGAVTRSALLNIEPRSRLRDARRLSSIDLSILSDNMNLVGEDPNAGMPSSFQTQMAMAMMKDNRMRAEGGADSADRDRMGRLVLARMKTLEESFSDVIKEMREMKAGSTAPTTRRNSSGEELHHGAPLIEVAGRDRRRDKGTASPKKAPNKRPVSRRSMKDGRPGTGVPAMRDSQGVGKDVASRIDDEEEGGDGVGKKESSI